MEFYVQKFYFYKRFRCIKCIHNLIYEFLFVYLSIIGAPPEWICKYFNFILFHSVRATSEED